MLPRDTLALVLILLLSQHQLDEELLQLLITVVNTKLLKAEKKKERNKERKTEGIIVLELEGNKRRERMREEKRDTEGVKYMKIQLNCSRFIC